MILKVSNAGRTIEGLPAEKVLRDERSPEPVVEALDAWREAVQGLQEPARVLREAEKAAQESTLLVRGERERYTAEIREKTTEEASALRAAERRSTAAARALCAALEAHVEDVRAVAARLALEAHAAAVDSALDVEAARRTFGAVAPRVPALPHVDPVLLARRRGTNVQESTLDALDRVNVGALAEIVGEEPERFGFVEVRNTRTGAGIWTTPRRAAALTAGRGSGWSLVGKEASA